MNNKVLEKVEEIIAYIENRDDYQKYLALKSIMDKEEDIKKTLEEIRILQKRLANNYGSKNELEKELEIKNKELYDNPLYRDYLNCVDNINNTFNIIENELNKYFIDKLN